MADPKWLELARKELGNREWPGSRTNPIVSNYYRDAIGHGMADSVPWCAAFVGAMLKRGGAHNSGSLMARSYLAWGVRTPPKPGAIAIFARGKGWQGHVAIIDRVTPTHVEVIGGNQSDAVTRKLYPRKAALDFRWPDEARKAISAQAQFGALDMTPQEIMDAARTLYKSVDRMGLGDVRPAAKKAAEMLFYLAKMHAVSIGDRKALKLTLPVKRKAMKSGQRARAARTKK